MNDYYLSSSDDDNDKIIKITTKKENNNKNSLELEFEELIEQKIRSDHKLELSSNQNETNLDKKKNEDFYDPNLDEEDEEFMQSLNRSNQLDKNSPVKSDATLNCPCCMALLSMETQRHDHYKNQYRAMFVFNCKVDKDNPVEQINKISKKRRKSKQQIINLESNSEIYYQVSCSECMTEVGVYDSDEVYHFYNTLASY